MATRKSPSRSTGARKRPVAAAPAAAARTPRTNTASSATARRRRVEETPVEAVEVEVAAAETARGGRISGFYSRYPIASLIAEFLGTFLFVSFAVVTQVNPLYAFFGLTAIVALLARYGRPQFNPALTIAAWLGRFISGRSAIFAIIAQILGGFAAFGILSLLSAGATTTDSYTGATTAASLYSLPVLTAAKEWYTFAAELIGSLILGFGVATALVRTNPIIRGVYYGGAFLVASFIAYASGAFAVINPVLAGALGVYKHIDFATFNLFPVLVYVIAPVVGAALGFGLYRLLEKSTVTE